MQKGARCLFQREENSISPKLRGLIKKKHYLCFPSSAKIWVTYTKCTCLFVFVFIFCSHTIILKYGVLSIRQLLMLSYVFPSYIRPSTLISAHFFVHFFFGNPKKSPFPFFWSKESAPSTQQKGLISPQKRPPPKKGLSVCVFDPRFPPSKRNIPGGHSWGRKRSMVWNGGKTKRGANISLRSLKTKKGPWYPSSY